MGKASRRSRTDRGVRTSRPALAPFVPRPFEGLPGETDWVAMREIVELLARGEPFDVLFLRDAESATDYREIRRVSGDGAVHRS